MRYTLHQGDLLVALSPAVPFRTFLLDAGTHSAIVKIAVIDETDTENIVKLNISIRPSRTVPKTFAEIREFLKTAATFARSGDSGTALILIQTAVLAIEQTNRSEQNQLVQLALQIVFELTVPGPIELLYMVGAAVVRLVNCTIVDHRVALSASQIIRQIAKISQQIQSESLPARRFVQETELWPRIGQLLDTIERLIAPTDVLPPVRVDEQVPISIDYPYIEQYPDYEDLNDSSVLPVLADRLRSVQNIEATIATLAEIIDHQLEPAEPDVRLALANLTLVSVAREFAADGRTSIGTGDDLMISIAPISPRHTLTVCAFRANPFWWYPEAYAANSDVVFAHLSEPAIRQHSALFTAGHVHASTTTISIIFEMRMPTADKGTDVSLAQSGIDMPVFALAVPVGGVLYVRFRLPSEADSLRVLLKADARPTHYEFVREYETISSGCLSVSWSNGEDRTRVLFMALMAVAPAAAAGGAELLDFQFRTKIGSCRRWQRGVWLSADSHCRVGLQTNRTHLHCLCALGRESTGRVFAAQLYVTPNQLRMPRDLQLALHDNWLVVGLVVLLLLVYGGCVYTHLSCSTFSPPNFVHISALLWAWLADRRTNQPQQQLHLYDAQSPAPGTDSAAHYLLTICTGHRSNAGTTATVSACVHGTRYTTGSI